MAYLSNRLGYYTKTQINNIKEIDYLSLSSFIKDKTNLKISKYTIQQKDLGRLDLVSYKIYGSVDYWWLLADYNNIIDIEAELYVGMILDAPDLLSLYNTYSGI